MCSESTRQLIVDSSVFHLNISTDSLSLNVVALVNTYFLVLKQFDFLCEFY